MDIRGYEYGVSLVSRRMVAEDTFDCVFSVARADVSSRGAYVSPLFVHDSRLRRSQFMDYPSLLL